MKKTNNSSCNTFHAVCLSEFLQRSKPKSPYLFFSHWGWNPYLVTQDPRTRLVPVGPHPSPSHGPLYQVRGRTADSLQLAKDKKMSAVRSKTKGQSDGKYPLAPRMVPRSWSPLIISPQLPSLSGPLDTCLTKSGCVCFFVNLTKIFWFWLEFRGSICRHGCQ